MLILLTAIVLLGLFAALAGRFINGRRHKTPEKEGQPAADSGCCGMHEVCERDSLLAAVSKEIVYYDDYELDDYKDMPASDYDAEAVSRFEDVFYTLRSEDVAGWVRSLGLRGIELPGAIRDEVLLIVGENREGRD